MPKANKTDSVVRDEHCVVCGRVSWRTKVREDGCTYFIEPQDLGYGHWRHDECTPGSPIWLEAYGHFPKSKRSKYGDFLFKHHTEGRA